MADQLQEACPPAFPLHLGMSSIASLSAVAIQDAVSPSVLEDSSRAKSVFFPPPQAGQGIITGWPSPQYRYQGFNAMFEFCQIPYSWLQGVHVRCCYYLAPNESNCCPNCMPTGIETLHSWLQHIPQEHKVHYGLSATRHGFLWL